MNGIVTGAADPESAGDQVFFREQFLESFLAVQVFGDQVMAGQPGDRALAEFAIRGLWWKFQHGGVSRVSPLALPDLRLMPA
jgi:hypothetical protein